MPPLTLRNDRGSAQSVPDQDDLPFAPRRVRRGLDRTIVLALIHLGRIQWPVFISMFVYIDLIGYLPGAVAYRQARGGHIWHGFYVFHHLA